jgi:transglutaminase-like putative cysteine protease
MEAYVGGRWYTLDPGHASPHVGSIAVAYGRDAADVALYTTFGASTLERFHVFTYAV